MRDLPPKLWGFRVLHLVWAALAIAASAVLVTSKGGHPPAIILLPVVLVAWVLGHSFLALVHHAIRRQGTRLGDTAASRWPIPIVALLVVAAGFWFFAINAFGWTTLRSVEVMRWHQILLTSFVIVAPGFIVVSILLRRAWGRYAAAAAPAAFFLYFAFRTISAFEYWGTIGAGQWLVAAAIGFGSGGLAYYLLKSKGAAEFFRG